jgi:hypothetical protein
MLDARQTREATEEAATTWREAAEKREGER